MMENTRASSYKTYKTKAKFPVILSKNSNITSSDPQTLLKPNHLAYSHTPEPSLTVHLKKIHKRPLQALNPSEPNDAFNKQTNEALSNLIKNNAITFISPNEFINQIHTGSQNPKRKSSETLNVIKSKKKSFQLSHYDIYQDFRVRTSSASYSEEKKIEITGFQITKSRYSHSRQSSSDPPRSVTSHVLNFSKVINMRKSYKPVIVYNKNHKYFRSKQEDNVLRLTSGSYYYTPNNCNL